MKTPTWLAAVLVVTGVACGPDSGAWVNEGDDEGLELAVAELNADAIVTFVNGADATFDLLTTQVRLDARAANGLVAGKPFASLAAIDAVPWVGSVALTRLDAFAAARNPGAGVSVEGVLFTAAEALDAVSIANDARLVQAGLSATATNNLVANRPYASVAAVGAVSGVGPVALTALRSFARSHPGSPAPAPAACPGGTFDGVAFSPAEDCRAADFLNRARFSEMVALPDAARLVAYEMTPGGTFNLAPRGAAWSSVSQFAARPGIGATAVTALKGAAAAWAYSGSSVDTVADAWARRTSLLESPVYFERVFVSRLLPQTGDLGGFNWECAEVRDTPGASNYLLVCKPAVVCGGACWQGTTVGAEVKRLHGTVKRSSIAGSGGYRVGLSN